MRPLLLSVLIVFASSGMVCPGALAANETNFAASLAYQDKELNFNQRYSGDATNEAEFNIHLPMVVVGLTAARGRWFASLKAEKNLAATSTTTVETDRSRVFEPNLLTHPGGTINVAREDYSFAIGYRIHKRFNIFTGFISGETTVTPDPFCANPLAAPPPGQAVDHPDEQECSRSNRAFLQFYLADLPQQLENPPAYYVADQQQYQQAYKEQGMFAGGSYVMALGDLGTLALSLAYANLDGEYSDNANDPNNGFLGSFNAFNYKGNTTGTSFAVTWTGSLGPRAAYTIDVRRQQYTLDARDQTGRLRGVFLTTEETMLGITTGVQVYF